MGLFEDAFERPYLKSPKIKSIEFVVGKYASILQNSPNDVVCFLQTNINVKLRSLLKPYNPFVRIYSEYRI